MRKRAHHGEWWHYHLLRAGMGEGDQQSGFGYRTSGELLDCPNEHDAKAAGCGVEATVWRFTSRSQRQILF